MKYRYSFTNFFRSFEISHYCYWNLGNLLTFMFSPPNDKYNVSYSRTQHTRKRKLHTWFLRLFWCLFFAFWGAENPFFHILPFRSRGYALKSFECLEVFNRVSNWNKSWKLFYVSSILQICQFEIPEIITKFMTIICIFSLFLLNFSYPFGIYVINHYWKV